MSEQVSRDHHTVPKLYLRGFCGRKKLDKDILLARHRNGTEERMPIKKATVEVDFYDVGELGQPDDSLEEWFSHSIENPVGEVMYALRDGALPPPGPGRATLATFVATQMVRTVAVRRTMQEVNSHVGPLIFASMVLQRAIEMDPAVKARGNLTAMYHDIARRTPEVMRRTDTPSMLRTMVREADRIKRLLLDMHWLLTSSPDPVLVTGDAPVVTVSATGELDFSSPVLLPDLHEVHVPITPSRLLTITPIQPLVATPTNLTIEQTALVNQAMVRNCWDMILRPPMMPWPAYLVLPRQRASIRKPNITVRANEARSPTPLSFPPIVDLALAEALEILGGDPGLSA
ncbi:DUF4238 domain-containing protein [Micromonospora sp. NPDC004551]|uniref:DUF4238 domain-containing protein n=1 Tax=Micromonospora sp. NPDC004551 TaxID=3154284 RepID=UPI00339F0EBE